MCVVSSFTTWKVNLTPIDSVDDGPRNSRGLRDGGCTKLYRNERPFSLTYRGLVFFVLTNRDKEHDDWP